MALTFEGVARGCRPPRPMMQSAEAMTRTELRYFVSPTTAGWVVRCEDVSYGPFLTFQDAFTSAVEEAQAAGNVGFRSMVLLSEEDRRPQVHWTYGRDPYPLLACGRA